MERSRNALYKAEEAYNKDKLLEALTLGIIAIGWMIDDLSSDECKKADYTEMPTIIKKCSNTEQE